MNSTHDLAQGVLCIFSVCVLCSRAREEFFALRLGIAFEEELSESLWLRALAEFVSCGFILRSSSEEHDEGDKGRLASVAASWSWVGFATCGYSRVCLALLEHFEALVV